jgi:hypothetical protein
VSIRVDDEELAARLYSQRNRRLAARDFDAEECCTSSATNIRGVMVKVARAPATRNVARVPPRCSQFSEMLGSMPNRSVMPSRAFTDAVCLLPS